MAPRIRFDRNELAGSFGDIGTDLPLIVGLILACGLDAPSVFIVFGALQIITGLLYGLPMPMQPLKAMAVIAITQKVTGATLFGGGLVIGAVMLLLALSGGLTLLARWIPRCVVRGVQFGLGLSLAALALRDYVPSGGVSGWILAGAAMTIMLLLWGNRRVPPGLLVIALGVIVAVFTAPELGAIVQGMGLSLPRPHAPERDDLIAGALLLALPQLPLSISNSVIATEQTVRDLFPERRVSVRRIGVTYAIVNLVAPLLGGIPVCHGCGGLAGHYAFGARTGGSVVIYGTVFLLAGLFLGNSLIEIIELFPRPLLGVVLLFEALTLMMLVRDQASVPRELLIALLVGVVALTIPQGFLVGLLLGTAIFYGFSRFGRAA